MGRARRKFVIGKKNRLVEEIRKTRGLIESWVDLLGGLEESDNYKQELMDYRKLEFRSTEPDERVVLGMLPAQRELSLLVLKLQECIMMLLAAENYKLHGLVPMNTSIESAEYYLYATVAQFRKENVSEGFDIIVNTLTEAGYEDTVNENLQREVRRLEAEGFKVILESYSSLADLSNKMIRVTKLRRKYEEFE